MKRISLALIITLVISTFYCIDMAVASNYVMKDLPQLDNGIVIAADVLNKGSEQLIVGKGSKIFIYDQNKLVGTISGFSGNVTALAVGDMNGNFNLEILVGTDAFNVHIYQLVNEEWLQIEVKRYFWAPISSLKVADITGNGWGDMIVTNTRGDAYIYLSWEGKLDIFWRSKPNEPVKFITAENLTGSRADDVVLTHDSGYVEVISWKDEKLRTLWQGYPWGTIDSLILTPIKAESPSQILILTDQNIFYSWKWDGNTFVPQYHFHQRLDGKIIGYHSEFGLIAISPKSGITFYNVGSNVLEKVFNINLTAISDIVFYNEQLVVKDVGSRYYALQSIDLEDIEIYINGELVDTPIEFLINEGRLYVSLNDITSILGWMKFGTKQRIFLIKGLNYLVVDGEQGQILWHNIPLPLHELISKDNLIYLPLESISIFGYEVRLDCTNNQLDLSRNWGWW